MKRCVAASRVLQLPVLARQCGQQGLRRGLVSQHANAVLQVCRARSAKVRRLSCPYVPFTVTITQTRVVGGRYRTKYSLSAQRYSSTQQTPVEQDEDKDTVLDTSGAPSTAEDSDKMGAKAKGKSKVKRKGKGGVKKKKDTTEEEEEEELVIVPLDQVEDDKSYLQLDDEKLEQLKSMQEYTLPEVDEERALKAIHEAQVARLARLEDTRKGIWQLVVLPLLIILAGLYSYYYWVLSFVPLDPMDARWFLAQHDKLFKDIRGPPLKQLEKLHFQFAKLAEWNGGVMKEVNFRKFCMRTLKLDISDFPEQWAGIFASDGDRYDFASFLRAWVLLQWFSQRRDPGWCMASLYILSYQSLDTSRLGKVTVQDIRQWLAFAKSFELIGKVTATDQHVESVTFTPSDFIIAFTQCLLPTSPVLRDMEAVMVEREKDLNDWKPDPDMDPERPENEFMKEMLQSRIEEIHEEQEFNTKVFREWLKERMEWSFDTAKGWLNREIQRRLDKVYPFLWVDKLNLSHGYFLPGARDIKLEERLKRAIAEVDPLPMGPLVEGRPQWDLNRHTRGPAVAAIAAIRENTNTNTRPNADVDADGKKK